MKNKDNKSKEFDNTDKKLNISDVIDSITLNKLEIWLINTLRWDINSILIAREQKKDFANEWSKRYCSLDEIRDMKLKNDTQRTI